MKNKAICIKIGIVIFKIIGNDLLIKALRKYYNQFLADDIKEDEIALTIVVLEKETKKYDDITVKSNKDEFIVYGHSDKGMIDVCVNFNKSKALITMPLKANRGLDWFEWEFNFRIAIFLTLIKKDHMLIHAAGLKINEKVYIITGESGAGKTTASLNCVRKNPSIEILNDDMVILFRKKETWYVAGTPYCSTSGLQPNMGVGILAGIYQIHKSTCDSIVKMNTGEVIQQIWTHAFMIGNVVANDRNYLNIVLSNAKEIAEKKKSYHLYATIFGEEIYDLIVKG